MPTVLEAGTLNGHGIAGLNAALSYLEKEGIDVIRKKEQELMWKFYNGVKDIPGIKIYGDFENRERCAIVTLNIGDYDSSEAVSYTHLDVYKRQMCGSRSCVCGASENFIRR